MQQRKHRQPASNPRQIQATLNGHQPASLPPPELAGDPELQNNPISDQQIPTSGTATSLDPANDVAPEDRKKPRRTSSTKKAPKLTYPEKLANIYASIGATIVLLDKTDGMLVMAQASDMATTLWDVAEDLDAKKHPELKSTLMKVIDGNVYFAFFACHLGLVLAILVNHNMIPKGALRLFGKAPEPPPDTVEQVPYMGQMTSQEAAMMQAYEQMMAQQMAQGAAQGYDPSDNQARPEHNPAFLGGLTERR